MSDHEALFQSISAIAKEIQRQHTIAAHQYAPVVNAIITTGSRDGRHIEQTLDRLLDHAGHPAGLELFKTLCRYYHPISPAATADYIHTWRELWDVDETERLA
jgi:hypothetical protein